MAGKTSKSLLVDISTNIEASEFWNARLAAYIRDLPQQVECEQKVLEAFEALESMDEFQGAHVTLVTELMKRLPDWRLNLRKVSLQQLEQKLTIKVCDVVKHALGQPSADLRVLQGFVAEVQVGFPLDQGVHQLYLDVAQKLTEESQQTQTTKIKELCKQLQNEESIENMKEGLQAFLAAADLITAPLDKEGQSDVTNAIEKLQGMLKQRTSEAELVSPPLDTTCVQFMELAKLCFEQEQQGCFQALASCWDLWFGISRSKVMLQVLPPEGEDDEEKHHPAIGHLQHLRVLSLKLLKAIDDLKELIKCQPMREHWVTPFRELQENLNKRLTSEVQWWTKTYEKQLESVCSNVANKLAPCKPWNLQANACKTYAAVTKLAKESILKLDGNALEERKNSMAEAFNSKNVHTIAQKEFSIYACVLCLQRYLPALFKFGHNSKRYCQSSLAKQIKKPQLSWWFVNTSP
eukprot:6491775-Amphidinium_carterae.3